MPRSLPSLAGRVTVSELNRSPTSEPAPHRVALLEGGDSYFPALIAACAAAQEEILLETYIFADDASGQAVAAALMQAAARGVRVQLILDGFGSQGHVGGLAQSMRAAGIKIDIYRPERLAWSLRRTRLRRLHRKLVTIDGQIAFVGGINIHDDRNLPDPSLGPRYDFALAVAGPVAREIRAAQWGLWLRRRLRRRTRQAPTLTRPAGRLVEGLSLPWMPVHQLEFIRRDNLEHRHDIEASYLAAILAAREEILIANAYFFPGRHFLTALTLARKRGVRVRLLLQGREEYWLQHQATMSLYDSLLDRGFEVIEYQASFLHAKVAVIDRHWATVGSSNIEPFSMLLALEANVVIEDRAFAEELAARLELAISKHSRMIEPEAWRHRGWLARLRNRLVYALTRGLMRVLGYGQY